MGSERGTRGAAGLHLADGVRAAAPGGAGVRRDAGRLAQPAAGPATWRWPRWQPGNAPCGRSPRTPTRSRGCGPPQLLDEWLHRPARGAPGCAARRCAATRRRSGCSARYLTDPAYGWAGGVRDAGSAPTRCRSCHEWNTAVHVQHAEGDPAKRAFTLDELQALLRPRRRAGRPGSARRGARAGCRRSGTPPCSRSPTGTGCGATRPGCSMSPTSAPTRTRPSSASYGVCYVRYGKAMKGSPPKRRSVLTVWPWVGRGPRRVDHRDPAAAGRRRRQPRRCGPRSGRRGSGWPRSTRRFAAYRDALGLDAGLDFHSLRRSYVTHLIEAGWDPLFVQHQVGHEHASTTVDLHLRVLGLPHPHPAPRAGRRPWQRGTAAGSRTSERADETRRSATSGGCARSWPPAACSPPPSSRRCCRARHRPVGLPGAPAGHRHPGTAVAARPRGAVRHPRGHPRRADRHRGGQHRAAQGRRRRRPGAGATWPRLRPKRARGCGPTDGIAPTPATEQYERWPCRGLRPLRPARQLRGTLARRAPLPHLPRRGR